MDHNILFDAKTPFTRRALEIFRMQAAASPVYGRYLSLIGCDPAAVGSLEEIPFLPIELFKSEKVYCGSTIPEIIFTSSGTGGNQSRHYVADLSLYESAFRSGWEEFYGSPSGYGIFALLPGYLEREGSSLIYMFSDLIEHSRGGGFFLREYEELARRLAEEEKGAKRVLIGVTFALLEFARSGLYDSKDPELIVMETGGMKGHGEELPRETVHSVLKESFGVETIHSEYGMCECLSQAYSQGGGIFRPSHTMRVLVRDLYDPFRILPERRRGGINIVDLANINSCSFIQTGYTGRLFADGSFTIEGRAEGSDLRGCNLLVTDDN